MDMDPQWGADHVVNILYWEYWRMYRRGYFHTIVCALPCTEYSTVKTSKPRNLKEAYRLVRRTLKIFKYFRPQFGWMENPRLGLLGRQLSMRGSP